MEYKDRTMNQQQIKALGLEGWDKDRIGMFENIISHIETYKVLIDIFKNSPVLNYIKGSYFVTPHESLDIIEKLTGKTFEEIQTIMEGE
jgi:hypothetical protein